jgi:hypothetical protein
VRVCVSFLIWPVEFFAGVGLAKTALSESTQSDVDGLQPFFDCAHRIWGLRRFGGGQ